MPGPGLPPRRGKKHKRPKLLGGYAPAAVGAIAAYWAWLTKSSSAKPQLWVGEGELKSRVLPHCSVLLQPYTPSPLALNVHLQNVLGLMRTATLRATYNRQLVMAHDGGTLGLDWFQACDAPRYGPADKPVLLVLHGLSGGSHEGYCKWVCHEACKRGWRAVVLNYRGCAGLPLTSPRGYAATLTHDVHYAITSIKARFPNAPLLAVGYSLGGLFLTKYLSESDSGLHSSLAAHTSSFTPFDGSGLVAAAVVSSPICLFNSSANLEVPWTPHYLYNMALAYKLREFMHEHQSEIRGHFATHSAMETAMGEWTIGGVEDAIVTKTFGFQSRQEYYEAVSSLKYIPHIATPTLFLMSQDDPFLGVLPDQECAANPHTLLAATEKGGHVAFLTGLWPLGPSYMDAAVLQFLDTAWQKLPDRAVRPLPKAVAQPRAQVPEAQQLWWQWGNDHSAAAYPSHVWLDADVLPQESREPHAPVDWGQGAGPHPVGHLRKSGPPVATQQVLLHPPTPTPTQQVLLQPPPPASQAGGTAAQEEEEAEPSSSQQAAAMDDVSFASQSQKAQETEETAGEAVQGEGQAVPQQDAQQAWAGTTTDLLPALSSPAADVFLHPPDTEAAQPLQAGSTSALQGGLSTASQPLQLAGAAGQLLRPTAGNLPATSQPLWSAERQAQPDMHYPDVSSQPQPSAPSHPAVVAVHALTQAQLSRKDASCSRHSSRGTATGPYLEVCARDAAGSRQAIFEPVRSRL